MCQCHHQNLFIIGCEFWGILVVFLTLCQGQCPVGVKWCGKAHSLQAPAQKANRRAENKDKEPQGPNQIQAARQQQSCYNIPLLFHCPAKPSLHFSVLAPQALLIDQSENSCFLPPHFSVSLSEKPHHTVTPFVHPHFHLQKKQLPSLTELIFLLICFVARALSKLISSCRPWVQA